MRLRRVHLPFVNSPEEPPPQRDDHDDGDADGTDDQGHDPEVDEEAAERSDRGGAGGGRIEGLTDVDLGDLGVGGRGEQRLHRHNVVGVRAHVDGARRASFPLALDQANVADLPLGGRVADHALLSMSGLASAPPAAEPLPHDRRERLDYLGK